MSIIAVSNVFLSRGFDDADSGEIELILKSVLDEVHSTRKGRHWEGYAHGLSVGLTIDVRLTENYLFELEDELLDLNKLPEDLPVCISIVTNTGTENALKVCGEITKLISKEVKGLSVGPNLCS